MSTDATERSLNFIEEIIEEHNRTGRFEGRVHTRFPPEPNGYLHIGHAKSICLNFGLAKKYGGKCNLRFDDTNPEKEEQEYVDSIMEDVRWLGFEWDGVYFASDYFEQLYEWAIKLVKKGRAYVCDLTADQIREYRGTLTQPGKNSPYRDRPSAESLDLFTAWFMFLLASGFGVAIRKPTSGALWGVVIPWAVYVLGKVGLAALMG